MSRSTISKCTTHTTKAVPKELFEGRVKSALIPFQTRMLSKVLKNLYTALSINLQFIVAVKLQKDNTKAAGKVVHVTHAVHYKSFEAIQSYYI